MSKRIVGLAVVTAVILTACGSGAAVIDPGDGGNYTFTLTASDFVERIDNPFLPLIPGSRWVYEGHGERTEVVVLSETRLVMGIAATIVHDTVSEGGIVIEDTYDWFAQDTEGNVWYLGEESVEYSNGQPSSTAGSWEAGIDGALPGVAMPAIPTVGQAYRQEYYVGEAEDLAEVARLGVAVTVPFGDYSGVLVITEWTPLASRTVEEKFYAAGVGMIKEAGVRGGSGGAELIEFVAGG